MINNIDDQSQPGHQHSLIRTTTTSAQWKAIDLSILHADSEVFE